MKRMITMAAVAALACSMSLTASAADSRGMAQNQSMMHSGMGGKMAVVDMKALIQHSPEVEADRKKLQAQFTPDIKKAQASAKALSALQTKYNKNQATMRTGQKSAMRKELEQKQLALLQERSALQQKIGAAKQKAFAAIINEVKGQVAQVAKRGHYAMVLPKNMVVYLDPSQVTDITSEVSAGMQSHASSASMMNNSQMSHHTNNGYSS